MAPLATGKVAGTILVIAEVPNFFSGLLPSMFTISSPFFHDQGARAGNLRRIRQGEIIASAISLGIGSAASVLFRSPGDSDFEAWLPLIGTVAMIGVLIACYEYAVSHPATSEGVSSY